MKTMRNQYSAVECPACKKVFTRQGMWNHILGLAKSEAIHPEDSQKHIKFVREKAHKKRRVTYVYDWDFKKIADDYYAWARKNK